MSVVSVSQFKLVRTRKLIEQAYQDQDWNALRHWDTELAECLNSIFDDSNRDARLLVDELESVLKMYAQIIAELPEDSVAPARI